MHVLASFSVTRLQPWGGGGVIRREGLGEMRHIDVSMLCVQQKHAERSLQFNKVAGAANPSDGQTKHVNKDRIDYYAKLCNCDFPSDMNKQGYTIHLIDKGDGDEAREEATGFENRNDDEGMARFHDGMSRETFVGIHACNPEVERELKSLLGKCGRHDAKIWSRCDLASATYRHSGKGGPAWDQVLGRIPVLLRPQKVVESKRVSEITGANEHGKLSEGKADLVTYLVHVEDRWKQSPSDRN